MKGRGAGGAGDREEILKGMMKRKESAWNCLFNFGDTNRKKGH